MEKPPPPLHRSLAFIVPAEHIRFACCGQCSTTKKSPDRSRIPVDIPTGWEPRTNQSPTGALIAFAALGTCCSSPVPSTTKKSPDRMVWGCGGAFSTAGEPLSGHLVAAVSALQAKKWRNICAFQPPAHEPF